MLAVVGDHVDDAKTRLTELLRRLDKLDSGGFDMEPLRVLAEMVDDPQYDTIGGYLQLVKVYRHLQVVPFVVERKGVRSLLGRPLLEYEEPDRYPVFLFA